MDPKGHLFIIHVSKLLTFQHRFKFKLNISKENEINFFKIFCENIQQNPYTFFLCFFNKVFFLRKFIPLLSLALYSTK